MAEDRATAEADGLTDEKVAEVIWERWWPARQEGGRMGSTGPRDSQGEAFTRRK